MATTRVKCPICSQEVYRNSRGQILMHTTASTGGRARISWGASTAHKVADICSGSTKGARP
jgi:ribosomal protein S27E